jgi:hypothetical protein
LVKRSPDWPSISADGWIGARKAATSDVGVLRFLNNLLTCVKETLQLTILGAKSVRAVRTIRIR